MSSTEERTAEQLRALVAAAAPAVTAAPGLAQLVLAVHRRRRRSRRRLVAGAGAVLLAGAVAAAALPGDYARERQPSGAMEPTILVGQEVVLRKDAVPTHGDIVRLTWRTTRGTFEGLSRVVGLPGDTVSCPDDGAGQCDRVVVSGRPLDEPWLTERTAPFGPVTVEPGQVFLLGDSRAAASDSRYYGPQRLSDVSGAAVALVGPRGSLVRLPGTPDRPLPTDGDTVDPSGVTPGSGTG